MSEPKLVSPLLDNFKMGDAISNHHGVRCCPAMPDSSDSKYIVKIISIPASQVQLQALLLTGAYPDEASAAAYFQTLANDVVQEAETLNRLSKLEGFVPFEGCQVVPMENAVGYEVYLLGTYRRSVARLMKAEPMTHLAAVNLGLDMCASLAVCRQLGYLYADLKPENIFVCGDKEFRIGDLGFLKLNSLKFASLPERYISAYTAPEIVDAYSDINATIDMYAAGMILYQIYNGGELPFAQRASGEELPAPAYADYEMAEIILKACAPDPKDRWQSPIAMGQAIVAYMQRNGVNDVPIIAPVEEHEELLDADLRGDFDPEPEDDDADVLISAVAVSNDTVEDQICLDEFYDYFRDDQAEAPQEDEDAAVPEENEELPQEESADEAEESSDEDIANLSFLDDLVLDDTTPSEDMAEDFSYNELSDDVSSILTQADDLISHEAPAPVVAPEPIEVPMPDPIVPDAAEDAEQEPEAEADGAPESAEQESDTLNDNAAQPAENCDGATKVVPIAVADAPVQAEEPEADPDPEAEGDEEEYDDYEEEDQQKERKSAKGIIIALVIIALLAGIAFCGYLFYRDYYLQSIDTLTVRGSEDSLVVSVISDVDESLLTVVCVDTYGQKQESPVSGGIAQFTDLNPNTLYTVKVQVTGLHKLTGEISASYTTPVQSEIISFIAITGNEEGSAILNFTVDGMDSETWTVRYSAEGEEERSATFSGHMVNITGLTSGKEYTFRLESNSSLFLEGNTELVYTAVDPIYAEDLAIVACTSNSLTVEWTKPADAEVESWTVHCYSESGYDATLEVTETSATFTGLNGNEAHTVEVIASSMSVGSRCYMTDNAVTVSDLTVTPRGAETLSIVWEFTGNAPTSQWLLIYTVDDCEQLRMVRTATDSATISPLIPGGTYSITILLEDGTTVFAEPLLYQAPEAENFNNYLLSSETIEASMCITPDLADWDHYDLEDDDYTDSFSVGSKASFVLHASRNYNRSDNIIDIMFVIHGEDGTLISADITQSIWTDMWYKRYCELDVPALPQLPGTYSIEIYFNGAFLHSQEFTVTE